MNNQRTWRLLTVAAALVVLIANGAIHGVWTGRWTGPEVDLPVDPTAALPMTIGDWVGTTVNMEEESPYRQELVGPSVARRYVNPLGNAITVFLTHGRTGPIALHTPKECYGGLGYHYPAPVKQKVTPPDARPATFWVSTFSRTDRPAPEHLRIFWSWNATGSWQAADSPRLAFAGHRTLYKLYLIRPTAKPDEPLDQDPAVELMPLLVRELEKSLFPGS